MKIKGVNLGNWLVLEKWMSPGLFAGTSADDEWSLPRQLNKDVYEARIKMHRSEYISERDFARIHAMGLNAVRIPVPYFIFGDREPYIGCIEELDHAFDWAEKYGIQILIDLHTAPDSQNGFDNGGICGVCKWADEPDEVEFELTVLERLAQRYGDRKGLFGIEILNEPVNEYWWEKLDVPNLHKASDPEMAKGSKGISMDFMWEYYKTAYERLRKYLPDEKYVVFHDSFYVVKDPFDMSEWYDFLDRNEFKNVMVDAHLYFMVAEMLGCEQTPEGYLDVVKERFEKRIMEIKEHIPVIIGEWCLSNAYANGLISGQNQTKEETAEERRRVYRLLADAQVQTWEKHAVGSFYWSYKLIPGEAAESELAEKEAWDFGRCVDKAWFPLGLH